MTEGQGEARCLEAAGGKPSAARRAGDCRERAHAAVAKPGEDHRTTSGSSPKGSPLLTHAVKPKHAQWALVVIATAQLMVMLDLTIVNIALPAMQHDLGFSTTNLSWVVDAYVLAFGGLLLLGGRTGDLFGRRRMFAIGVSIFVTASLAGGLATTQPMLIAARSLQGLGAAIASPTALSLIATSFQDGPLRHRAMAVYAAMSGAGGALGLLLGGLLVDVASWRWVLFVNVPIGSAVVLATPFVLPRGGLPQRGRLDLPGALSASSGIALLVYGLVRAPVNGWSNPISIAAFAGAAALLATFVIVETHTKMALLPLKFLRHRNRLGGYTIMFLLGGSMLALLYFLTQFLQDVQHYSPIVTGVAYLPIPLVIGSVGFVISRHAGRLGVRRFLIAGPALVSSGLLWLSRIDAHTGYAGIFGPLVLVGLGMGLSFVPLTLNAVAGVSNHDSGLASGLINTSQTIGGSLVLAALVTVAATVTRDHLLHAATASAHTMVSQALSTSIHGYQSAFLGGSIASATAVIVAALTLRRGPAPGPAPGPARGFVKTLPTGEPLEPALARRRTSSI